MQLTCPKCQGSMRQYERNGVHVDQCAECRGIFLDRGELERLIDAEASFHSQPATAPAPAASRPQQSYPDHDSREQGYRDQGHRDQGHRDQRYPEQGYPQQGYSQHGYQQSQHKKKRRSFLEDLFD